MKKNKEETTARTATTKEISSEFRVISALKEEQRAAPKDFLRRKYVFGRSLVKHSDASQLATGW